MVKFNKTDRVIFSVSILIILIYSYYLYDDSFLFNSEKSSYNVIGTLSSSNKDVLRKPVESFLWSPAKVKEVLHEQDSIFTGERSKAEIQLSDGSIIQLSENSLITLTRKSGDLELNLKYGEIQTEIKSTAKLQVKTEKENFVIQNYKKNNSKMKIKRSKSEEPKFGLLDGSLSISSLDKKEKKILDKVEPVKVEPIKEVKPVAKIKLLSPDKTKITLLHKEQGFFLNWSSENITEEKLIISSDNKFESITTSKEKVQNKALINNINSGKYFWKVQGLDSNNNLISSPVQNFELSIFTNPTITSPNNKAQLDYQTNEDISKWTTNIPISWQSDFIDYEYQISSNEDFSKDLISNSTNQKNINFKARNGKYYLRVRGKHSNALGSWSPTVSFDVVAHSIVEPPLESPILLTKNIKIKTKNTREPASVLPAKISWAKPNGASKFILEISQNKDFTGKSSIELKSDTYSYLPQRKAKQFFRVKAVSKTKVESAYSEIGELSVEIQKPTLFKILPITFKSTNPNESIPNVEFPISWTNVPLVKKYSVEYADNPSFIKSKLVESTKNALNIKVSQPGPYYFRVIASLPEDNQSSFISNSEKTEYVFKQKIPAPVLNEPRNKMTVFLQQELEPFIWINWEAQKSSDQYHFQLSTDKEFKKFILDKKITDNKFLIKERLPLGKIYWRVRSLNKDEDLNSDWSVKREFILLHSKNNESFQ